MADRGTATATIVFTDVVGSTQVRSHLGEIEADRLFREHERTLTEVVAAHQGRVVKAAGDGIMATFDAASDAVAAAVSMQRRVSQPALHHGGGADLQLRIGIAAGDVSWEDGDCFGLPVVIAARLEADADAGQILVSHVVRWLAGDRAGTSYVDLGPRAVRGLDHDLDVYEVAWEPVTEPATGQGGSVELPAALAMPSTFQFVGRTQEWAELAEVWGEVRAGGNRVALIGGEAGAGKTRLAVEFAARRARPRRGGAVRRLRQRAVPAVPTLGPGPRPPAADRARGAHGRAAPARAGRAAGAAPTPRPLGARPGAPLRARPRRRPVPPLRRRRRGARRGGGPPAGGARDRRPPLGRDPDPRAAPAPRPLRHRPRHARDRHLPRHQRRDHRAPRVVPRRPPPARRRLPAPARGARRGQRRALPGRGHRPSPRRRPPPHRARHRPAQRRQRLLRRRAVAPPGVHRSGDPRRQPLDGERERRRPRGAARA